MSCLKLNQLFFLFLSFPVTNSAYDKVEFGFFVARYALTLSVFVLGIKAPGILQARDYLLFMDQDQEVRGEKPEFNSIHFVRK